MRNLKALKKNRLTEALNVLSTVGNLYVPSNDNGLSGFVPYRSGINILLDENPLFSPKTILFPSVEPLYRYEPSQTFGDPSISENRTAPESPTLLFAVRSCDVQAISCLDDVFLQNRYTDPYYAAKRNNTTIIALSCIHPGDRCFCESMGLNPMEHPEADLQFLNYEDFFGLSPHTPKGHQILSILLEQRLLSDCEPPSEPKPFVFATKVNPEGLTEKLQQMFEHPIWEDIASTCLNCGICTYVCPACHCFDLVDHAETAYGGSINRCWDSCMFAGFTSMAGGHNPRQDKKQRVRQRFLHKLQYFPERHGKWLCTGCGRCLEKCPVHLEITQVIERLKEAGPNVAS